LVVRGQKEEREGKMRREGKRGKEGKREIERTEKGEWR
jgi:hypothetical protein